METGCLRERYGFVSWPKGLRMLTERQCRLIGYSRARSLIDRETSNIGNG